MENYEVEKEWMEKYDIITGRLKADLSPACYEFTQRNVQRISELTKILIQRKLHESYLQTINLFKKYIDTSEENYKIISLWVIATYFHSNFSNFPYLFFNAMRGSGKTRTLKLISALSSGGDGSVQNNLTEAVLFRIPRGTTTCIDEVEQINNKEKQTLRELLNSAYKKGTKVKRMKKVHAEKEEKQVAEVFEPYFPIAMANIAGVEEVLADRSIVLTLEKSDNPAMVMKIEDFDRNPEIAELKRTFSVVSGVSVGVVTEKDYIERWNNYIDTRYNTTLYTYIHTHTHNTLTTLKDKEEEEWFNKIHDLKIIGRNLELTFPLLVIAQTLSREVFEEMCIILSMIVATKKEEEYQVSKDVAVYQYVASLKEEGFKWFSVKQLTLNFRLYIGDNDDEDRWLNDRWFGRALKRLNLVLDRRRLSSGVMVSLNYSKAELKLKIFKGDEKNEP